MFEIKFHHDRDNEISILTANIQASNLNSDPEISN